MELFEAIKKQDFTFPNDLTISDDCKDIICKLLIKEPDDRLGHENDANDIKSHRWFKNFNLTD